MAHVTPCQANQTSVKLIACSSLTQLQLQVVQLQKVQARNRITLDIIQSFIRYRSLQDFSNVRSSKYLARFKQNSSVLMQACRHNKTNAQVRNIFAIALHCGHSKRPIIF